MGETLTAGMGDIADADGLPATFPDEYTFQWLRVDADGVSNETPIGADAATYTLVAADVGKKIKVQVNFTDDGGTSEDRDQRRLPVEPGRSPTTDPTPRRCSLAARRRHAPWHGDGGRGDGGDGGGHRHRGRSRRRDATA